MPKKETQLDRIARVQRKIETRLNVIEIRLETIIGHCDGLHADISTIRRLNDNAISDAYERGKASAAPQPAEPWRPEVGDVVICEKRHTNGPSPQWNEAMDQFVGVPMIVRNNVRTYCVSTDKGWLWHHDWLRPATPAELVAYHQEQEERLRREREEAERARPVGFGVAVKIKHSGNEGLVHYQLRDQPGRYSIIFNGGEQSNYNRDQFTVIHDQP